MSNFTSPAIQAMNLIRYIGDEVSGSGRPIEQLSGISGITDSPSEELANQILEELYQQGILSMADPVKTLDGTLFVDISLTPSGREWYEVEKRGRFEGKHGFIAMQFGDPDLTLFVEEVVKPAVKRGIGCDLVNMNDVARAGVIDNIMRTQIREATFVVVDLTHGNPEAYWEAGYAEGLGKPVLYICESGKFEAKKTHFDTNHCTTVPWSRDDDEEFCQRLTATLRRSFDQS